MLPALFPVNYYTFFNVYVCVHVFPIKNYLAIKGLRKNTMQSIIKFRMKGISIWAKDRVINLYNVCC